MLTQLEPLSHWLAGQIAGVHLSTRAGGLMIGTAAVLLYHSIGRIAGVSGIFFTGMMEGDYGAGCFSAASRWFEAPLMQRQLAYARSDLFESPPRPSPRGMRSYA